jgi:hypothetical protein
MAYYIFLKSLRSLEEFGKNPHVKIPPKSPSTNFQSLIIIKNQIFIRKRIFLHFRPIRPSGQPAYSACRLTPPPGLRFPRPACQPTLPPGLRSIVRPSWPARCSAPLPPGPYKKRAPPLDFTAPPQLTLPLSRSPCSPVADLPPHGYFLTVARPPHRCLGLGEPPTGFPAFPSHCCTPAGELPCSTEAGGQAPVSAPPCPLSVPPWTGHPDAGPRAMDQVHGISY